VARPAKSLQERVRDRSFLARRHGGLLAGPLVGPDKLREIQEHYRRADSDVERRAWAIEYEHAAHANDPLETAESPSRLPRARGEGFALPVARFFTTMFAHVKGPAAGQAFTLEPWQRRFVEEFTRTNGGGERIYKRGMLGVARETASRRLRPGWRYASSFARTTSRTSSSPPLLAIRPASSSSTPAASSSRDRLPTCSRSAATRFATL
jgi:hypothetical protein